MIIIIIKDHNNDDDDDNNTNNEMFFFFSCLLKVQSQKLTGLCSHHEKVVNILHKCGSFYPCKCFLSKIYKPTLSCMTTSSTNHSTTFAWSDM